MPVEFDSIRPVLSGVVGGIVATWLTSRWARNLPVRYNQKSRELLLRQHRVSIWAGNALFFAGLCFGVALYPLGNYANTDWHPMLWGFGLASALPLLAIPVISVLSGRSSKEAYVAFAWGQGTPLWATYGLLGLGTVLLIFAVVENGI